MSSSSPRRIGTTHGTLTTPSLLGLDRARGVVWDNPRWSDVTSSGCIARACAACAPSIRRASCRRRSRLLRRSRPAHRTAAAGTCSCRPRRRLAGPRGRAQRPALPGGGRPHRPPGPADATLGPSRSRRCCASCARAAGSSLPRPVLRHATTDGRLPPDRRARARAADAGGSASCGRPELAARQPASRTTRPTNAPPYNRCVEVFGSQEQACAVLAENAARLYGFVATQRPEHPPRDADGLGPLIQRWPPFPTVRRAEPAKRDEDAALTLLRSTSLATFIQEKIERMILDGDLRRDSVSTNWRWRRIWA